MFGFPDGLDYMTLFRQSVYPYHLQEQRCMIWDACSLAAWQFAVIGRYVEAHVTPFCFQAFPLSEQRKGTDRSFNRATVTSR